MSYSPFARKPSMASCRQRVDRRWEEVGFQGKKRPRVWGWGSIPSGSGEIVILAASAAGRLDRGVGRSPATDRSPRRAKSPVRASPLNLLPSMLMLVIT